MVNIKEIKSVKPTSYTQITASIYGILAFIAALVSLISLIIMQAAGVVPQDVQFNFVTGLGIPMLIFLPIAAFLVTLTVSFFSAILYNLLAPKLGGIRLAFEDNDVVKIPVVAYALITSAIGAIWAFIAGLLMAAFITPLFSLLSTVQFPANVTANFTNVTGATMPQGAEIGAAGIIVGLLLVIGLPILVFVFGFIANALSAIFYNYIVVRVAKIKLNFAEISEGLHELKSIPIMPTSLAVALIFAIQGILTLDIANVISNFIFYFIGTALFALIYNYLAPKIGSIKLNLEVVF